MQRPKRNLEIAEEISGFSQLVGNLLAAGDFDYGFKPTIQRCTGD